MRKIHALFSRVVSYMIVRLPPHVKRTVLLSSFAALLNSKVTEDDIAEDFNHEIIRAKELGAVKFSMLIANYVWYDLLQRHKYVSLLAIPEITDGIPKEFLYDTINHLNHDLRKVIDYNKQHLM